MRKLIVALLALSVAAFSPAPILDQRPGQRPQAEHTQDQIAAQQHHQMQMGELGATPSDTEPNAHFQTGSNADASNALRAGNAKGSGTDSDEAKAAAALREASKGANKGKGPNFLWIAILACVIGFGAVAGLRAWANRSITPPDDRILHRL